MSQHIVIVHNFANPSDWIASEGASEQGAITVRVKRNVFPGVFE
jgi:hypothetical protein